MNESTIPPPPKSGNLGLTLGIVALVLGGGGFGLWYALRPSPQAEVAAVVPPSVSVEAPRNVIPPPPPPPPPSLPDGANAAASGSAAGSGKALGNKLPTPVGGPSNADGCQNPCEGVSDRSFESALRSRAAQARSCYDRTLRQNEHLQGKLTVALRISPEGKACQASVVDDSMQNAAINACILKNFRAGSYPAPRGGCVNARVPLNFVSK